MPVPSVPPSRGEYITETGRAKPLEGHTVEVGPLLGRKIMEIDLKKVEKALRADIEKIGKTTAPISIDVVKVDEIYRESVKFIERVYSSVKEGFKRINIDIDPLKKRPK